MGKNIRLRVKANKLFKDALAATHADKPVVNDSNAHFT
jgi:hypothetical protein